MKLGCCKPFFCVRLIFFFFFRSNAFDVCLCIAVLHHLSTPERRLAGLKELVRVTRPGGLVLVYVWALEQEAKKVKKSDLKEVEFTADYPKRNGNKGGSLKENDVSEELPTRIENFSSSSENSTDCYFSRLRVNASREAFEQQDLFVPWKYSGPGKQQEKQERAKGEKDDNVTECHVFHRYYHVFQDGELRELCNQVSDVTVEKLYYDKGNWCVILRKQHSDEENLKNET